MFKLNFDKRFIKRLVKFTCIIQFVNAFMDYFLWVTSGYHVPSWALATLVAGYSVLLLSYDRIVT